MKEYGSIAEASLKLGISKQGLFAYIDPKGAKREANKPIQRPGPAMMRKLAGAGINTNWLLTGEGKWYAPTHRFAPPDEEESDETPEMKSLVLTRSKQELLTTLEAMGITDTNALKYYLQPEVYLMRFLREFSALMHLDKPAQPK